MHVSISHSIFQNAIFITKAFLCMDAYNIIIKFSVVNETECITLSQKCISYDGVGYEVLK